MRTQRFAVAQRTYHQRAKTLLNSAYQTGLRDAELEALLARLAWEGQDFYRATQLATAALEKPSLLSPAHAIALYVLSDSYMRMNDFPGTSPAIGQLETDRGVVATKISDLLHPWDHLVIRGIHYFFVLCSCSRPEHSAVAWDQRSRGESKMCPRMRYWRARMKSSRFVDTGQLHR
jgi:hypothetical protein